jgi:hypothetical protein
MSYSSRLRDRARFVRSLLARLPLEARAELLGIADVLDREQRSDAGWAWLARWVPQAPDDPVSCLPLWQWVDHAASALAENNKASNRTLTALVGLGHAVRGEKRAREALRSQRRAPLVGRPEKVIDPHDLERAIALRVELTAKLQKAQRESPSDFTYRAAVRQLVDGQLLTWSDEKRRALVAQIGTLTVKPSLAAATIAARRYHLAVNRVVRGRAPRAVRKRAPRRLVQGGNLYQHEHAIRATAARSVTAGVASLVLEIPTHRHLNSHT